MFVCSKPCPEHKRVGGFHNHHGFQECLAQVEFNIVSSLSSSPAATAPGLQAWVTTNSFWCLKLHSAHSALLCLHPCNFLFLPLRLQNPVEMWVNLKVLMEKEYILRLWNVLESAKLIYSDRSHISGYLEHKGECCLQRGTRNFLKWLKCSISWLRWRWRGIHICQNSMNSTF